MEAGVMPKELVMSGREFSVLDDGKNVGEIDPEPGSGAVYRRGVIVRWGRAQWPMSPDPRVELGVAKVETSTHDESDQHYLSLDRSDINRLIRSLRKARDQAYGVDA